MDVLVASLGLLAGLLAIGAAWIGWRARTLERFREKASGATHALAAGDRGMSKHLAGEAAPRAAGVRTWVPGLGGMATSWLDALERGEPEEAQAAEKLFEKNARWTGLWR